jgi:hypothetical protein
MTQSRRSLMRIVGMLLPSLAILPYSRHKALKQLIRPNLGEDSEFVIRNWLNYHGVTSEKLDITDSRRARSTGDLRRSFQDDPLISVGGLLLPTGFCRYCLARRSDDDQPRVS